MDKFKNKIDFINGNIKSVNNRINLLEDKYQVILNQLNNIFKIVSSHYYYNKKKTSRSTNKEKTIKEKDDLFDNKKFMGKIKDLYNDDEYNIKVSNNEFNKVLKRIEPFLIKKFKNSQ